MRKKRSIIWIVLKNIGGFLLFLVALALANIFLYGSSNQLIVDALDFLNNNLGLIIIFSIFFFLAELFEAFILPFNLPYPVFNAFGGFLLVIFIFRIFLMIGNVTEANLFPLTGLRYIIATFVFFIVLIVGYVKIFIPTPKKKKQKEKKIKSEGKTEWSDVGEEFRMMLLDIIKGIRDSFKKKK